MHDDSDNFRLVLGIMADRICDEADDKKNLINKRNPAGFAIPFLDQVGPLPFRETYSRLRGKLEQHLIFIAEPGNIEEHNAAVQRKEPAEGRPCRGGRLAGSAGADAASKRSRAGASSRGGRVPGRRGVGRGRQSR